MNRSVTPPADGGGVRLAPMDRKRPRRSRAVAIALDVQRQSLVWPVTASARGRSFLADPGTCRASPAAPLGVPVPPVGCSLCRFASASLFEREAGLLQGGINVNRGRDALSQKLPASRHGHEQPSSLLRQRPKIAALW